MTSLALALSATADKDGATRAEPERPLVQLFTADDYPPTAEAQGLEGRVQIRFRVGADGMARQCKAISSSGHDILDRAACDIIVARARYRPARNAAGDAVSDVVTTHVRWALADSDHADFVYERMTLRMTRASGAAACAMTINENETPFAHPEMCEELFGPMTALLDNAGSATGTELILVQVFEPEDRAGDREQPGNHGDLLLAFATALTVDDSGAITACATGEVANGPAAPESYSDTFEPCRAFAGQRFGPGSPGTERRARIEGAFYLARTTAN